MLLLDIICTAKNMYVISQNLKGKEVMVAYVRTMSMYTECNKYTSIGDYDLLYTLKLFRWIKIHKDVN